MNCRACRASLPPLFPGGIVRCACGLVVAVPYEGGPSAARDPYRDGTSIAEPAHTPPTCVFCGMSGAGRGACDGCGLSLAAFACDGCGLVGRDAACGACGGSRRASRHGPIPCPRCGGALAGAGIDPCATCGGLFVTHLALASLRGELGRRGGAPFAPRAASSRRPAETLRCPVCGVPTTRRSFGARAERAALVDVCAVHGTWMSPADVASAAAGADGPAHDAREALRWLLG